ncbi:hypothetical protein [Thermoflexus sp.]|uniref:hypothetical protein n=1 Tax=Thermoflexus sp. TaxID=1969742 RepID=UPI002ADE8109|nr:hypothetical protein [Thermoflexus sp.]
MPPLSRYMIRMALWHLAFGFLIGGLMLAHKAFPYAPWVMRLLPWHIHSLFIGWTVQLAFGVAYWIFPRFALERPGDPRGRTGWAWASMGWLNAGVLGAGLAGATGWGIGIALGVGLEALGVLAFVIHLWPRVRPAIIR